MIVLQHLLDMWPDIKKQVPAAELHIFYGWNIFTMQCLLKGIGMLSLKNDMVALMKQDGVLSMVVSVINNLLRNLRRVVFMFIHHI